VVIFDFWQLKVIKPGKIYHRMKAIHSNRLHLQKFKDGVQSWIKPHGEALHTMSSLLTALQKCNA
jgi:hypothetical protein